MKIQARSIDWVGHVSDETAKDVVVDRAGPIFIPVKIPQWTSNIKQEIIINISDSVSGYGSGVDPLTINYRMMDENGFADEWMIPERIRASTNGLTVTCYPELHSEWKGTIQFRADDNYGNPSRSEFYPLNVDVKGPQIELTGGPSFDLLEVGPVTIPIRVIDRGGSGVNGDSIEIRIRDDSASWGNWNGFGTGSNGEDIRINGSLFLGGGNYEIQFRAYDVVGNIGISEEYWISLSVPVIDLPPLVVIRSPYNGSLLPMNVKVEFDSEGTEDDHIAYDGLEISWWSNISGHIGSGGKISRYLSVGNHTITLRVSDGKPGHNVSSSVYLVVYDPNSGGSTDTDSDEPVVQDEPEDITWMVLLASMVGIIIIGLIFFFFFRSRDRNEMILKIREKTEDDEDDNEEEEWS